METIFLLCDFGNCPGPVEECISHKWGKRKPYVARCRGKKTPAQVRGGKPYCCHTARPRFREVKAGGAFAPA